MVYTIRRQRPEEPVPILQIEHRVRDFDAWKLAFDRDPVGRARGGVRGYRILRPVDDAKYVVVELAFDDLQSAERFRESLRNLWRRAEAEGLIGNPQARILEDVESGTPEALH
jgi:hypothetical protein